MPLDPLLTLAKAADALGINEDRRAMPKAERLPVETHLREQGHSYRAIAGAVGVSQEQVRQDLSGVNHLTPATTTGLDGKSYPAIAGALGISRQQVAKDLQDATDCTLPDRVTGLDGKSYPARKQQKLPVDDVLRLAADENRRRTVAPVGAACVGLSGWPLFAVARVLRRSLPDYLRDLPPHLRAPIEDTFAEMQRASDELLEASRGTQAGQPAELTAPSYLDTDEAAAALDCTSRWIRHLIAEGHLPAKRKGRRWRVRAADLHKYRRTR